MRPPRHRALAEQSVEVSENRGLERDHLEGDDLLLPEFDLPLAGGGKFAAGDQQPVALGKNLRRQGGGRHRQDVDAMALAGTFERLKPDFEMCIRDRNSSAPAGSDPDTRPDSA